MASTLVLGGARSGKSATAEKIAVGAAAARGRRPIYIATAEARDGEMAARIARHRIDRGPDWRTVEAPLELEAALRETATDGAVVLVDCLTLWLTNNMLADDGAATDDALEAAGAALLRTAAGADATIVFVSNEVGLGIAPATPLGRRFRDAQGRLNQAAAAAAERALFVAAGLPLALKGRPWLEGEEASCPT